MASPNCTNTDISGIGVRSATYAQNLLSFVPAAVALINDGEISQSEREFIQDQSANILLTAFGLLLSAIIQAKTDQGLDNYHAVLVLNLSWLNNTNTFIYLALIIHRFLWRSSSTKWSWGLTIPRRFRQPPKNTKANNSTPDVETANISSQQIGDQSAQKKPEYLLDSAVWIGSLHLSLMGGVGVWLWSNPISFGSSASCPPNATTSVLGRTLSISSPGLRVISLIFYTAVLIPIVNLVLPTALILIPYLLYPYLDYIFRILGIKAKRESIAAWCVALGLVLLFAINVIFIVDTELSISRNESREGGQDTIWTLGQTLALLLLVLPIRGLIKYLSATTSLGSLFGGETDWGRAVEGFRKCKGDVSWSEVYRWRWLVGDTPVKVDSKWLLRAQKERQLDMKHFLLENGANWNTLLEDAVTEGNLENLLLAVENGVDVKDRRFLHLAVESGRLDIVRFLVENGANVKSQDSDSLCWAAKFGHLDIVCFLVGNGADVKSQDSKSLHLAVEPGHLDIVRFLVKNGADVKSQDSNSLYIAVSNGHPEIVRFLVEHGVDVNSKDGRSLYMAAEKGHLEIVRFLVENGADIKSRDGGSLHIAAEKGHLEIVRFLVENGADIKSRDAGSLHMAAEKGHLEIVRFLVENGADIESRDGGSLHMAAEKGHLEIVRFLVENGADIESRDGWSLYMAAEKGHLEIVRFLVENGADVKSQDGRSLYVAADNGHLAIVRFLVEHGAHVNGKPFYQNKTPLDMAVENGHTEIVSYLRNNGGVQTSGRIRRILTATLVLPRKLRASFFNWYFSHLQ